MPREPARAKAKEEPEILDMFSGSLSTGILDVQAGAQRASAVGSWDDPDGYYVPVVSEVVNGNDRITSVLGRGVFSSVVGAECVDKSNDDTVGSVAIKNVGANEMT
jgi:hypothetical protein